MSRTLKPIEVLYQRKAINDFKAIAKRAYPRETYGILSGTDASNGHRCVVIQEVFCPEGVEKFCGREGVSIQDAWFVEAEHYAEESGLSVVGDIHSHPGVSHGDRSRSEDDHCFRWDCVEAICTVNHDKNGKLSSSVRFWGPVPPVRAMAL